VYPYIPHLPNFSSRNCLEVLSGYVPASFTRLSEINTRIAATAGELSRLGGAGPRRLCGAAPPSRCATCRLSAPPDPGAVSSSNSLVCSFPFTGRAARRREGPGVSTLVNASLDKQSNGILTALFFLQPFSRIKKKACIRDVFSCQGKSIQGCLLTRPANHTVFSLKNSLRRSKNLNVYYEFLFEIFMNLVFA